MNLGGWVSELVFERRMRHNPSGESVFVGWHGVELFAVPTWRRLTLYHLVPTWKKNTVECFGVYPILTPWLYI